MKFYSFYVFILLFSAGSIFSTETVRITGLSSPQLSIQTTPARMLMGTLKIQIPEKSEKFENAIYILAQRGVPDKPGQGYSFIVQRPVTVYLAVHKRGKPTIPPGWVRVPDKLSWQLEKHGNKNIDTVYRRYFPAGKVEIPPMTVLTERKVMESHIWQLFQQAPNQNHWRNGRCPSCIQPLPRQESLTMAGSFFTHSQTVHLRSQFRRIS